jgi:hypothetical protein
MSAIMSGYHIYLEKALKLLDDTIKEMKKTDSDSI